MREGRCGVLSVLNSSVRGIKMSMLLGDAFVITYERKKLKLFRRDIFITESTPGIGQPYESLTRDENTRCWVIIIRKTYEPPCTKQMEAIYQATLISWVKKQLKKELAMINSIVPQIDELNEKE